MLKDVVLRQKQEKERLISLPYIRRTKEAEAKKLLSSDLIKVILGPRRAGKSVFSLMLLKDQSFSYFNFDDESVLGEDILNFDELMQELKRAYGDTKYVLFDEIQNIPQWELLVNRLQRQGYNLVLTGSNARLLSKELATALTGRHVPIQILPFDFGEFLRAKHYDGVVKESGQLLEYIHQYMITGGYPEVVIKEVDPRGYLDVLFDALLFKDVVKRHRVRFSEQIDALGSYLINNVSNQYSIRKLATILGAKSGVTLERYLSYLTEAYLIFTLNRYSAKAGVRLKSPRKAYVVDNGFVLAKATQHAPDSGRLLENMVFVELVKQGNEPNRELFYYKTLNDREVDFVIRRGTEVRELIQVCYDPGNPDVERREVRALIEAGKELHTSHLSVLTWSDKREMKKDGVTIHFKPIGEWLFERIQQ